MSAPSPDQYQQLLAQLQVWRDLLERSTAPMAGLAPNVPFMPPGMPAMPTGMPAMPPAAPLLPPAPADYAQQLFGYLQAWRQYLEQTAGAPPQSSANSVGNQHRPGPSVVHKPPPDPTGSKGGNSAEAPTSASQVALPPQDQGVTANSSGNAVGSQPEKWTPDDVWLEPAYQDGTFVPNNYSSAILESGGPFAQNRAGDQAAQVLLRPAHDYGSQLERLGRQWLPTTLRRTGTASPAPTAAAPAPSSPPPAVARRAVGSPFLATMARVRPDASPPAQPTSLFRGFGQTPSP
jgi:hypothetical protein